MSILFFSDVSSRGSSREQVLVIQGVALTEKEIGPNLNSLQAKQRRQVGKLRHRGEVKFPRSHNGSVAKLGTKPRSSDFQSRLMADRARIKIRRF